LTSLRDLYSDAEEELARGDADVAAVVAGQGGSFVGEAARLGEVIASMHRVLADPSRAHLETAPASRQAADAWADAMTAELHALLEQGGPALESLRERAPLVRRHFDALRDRPPSGTLLRIHGDLHLGQTLRIDSGWIILDFEGEPNRTPAERRALSSPLRDVAGMLRSFDYAAAAALSERIMPGSEDWEGYMRFGEQWAQQNRTAFWNAYSGVMADAGVLPDREVAPVVLHAFELQKAVYEVGYELSHRPTWVTIPLRFLLEASHAASR
jgi:maltokinase